MGAKDRQAPEEAKGVHGSPALLGGRANTGVAGEIPAFEQGLRGASGERGGDHPERDDLSNGPPIGARVSFSHRL